MSVKSGWKTTEFWTKLIPQVLGVLALFGVLTPEGVGALVEATELVVGGLAIAIPEIGYAISRGKVKSNGK